MQKKALLYVFGIAAFLGLILSAGFFANEVRLKMMEKPGESQYETDQSLLPDLAGIAKKKAAPNPAPLPNQPTAPPPPVQNLPAPEASPENVPEKKPDADGNNNDFTFAVLGDTQKFDPDKEDGGLKLAVKKIKEKNVGLIMTVGDLLDSCDGGSKCEKNLNEWKTVLGELFSKTYAVMGNHDRSGEEKADSLWKSFFDLPQNGPEGYQELTYSFDFKNSHFVVLDSEKPDNHKIDKTQRDWLEKDLKDNKKDNTFVFFHEPAYPVSRHIGSSLDTDPGARDDLWEIIKDHKVTAVFNGHEHIVARKKIDGIYQYIFGNTDASDYELPKEGETEYSHQGKSYGIVEVKGKEVTVNAYSTDGNLLDSFKIPE